jgi:hypothetical protein
MRSWKNWLAETHSVGFELRRHFFARFFDSEFISSPGQAKVVAGGALAILISLSILFTQAYYHKYLRLGALDDPQPFLLAELADVLFIITLAMLAMALFATLQWPSLFPGLRDYMALAGLPVRMRDVFVAKFTALTAFAALATAATTSLPSVVLPAVMSGGWAPHPVRQLPAIFISASSACLFVFLCLVAVQGVLLNVVSVRQFPRVSLSIQGLLLTVFVCALPFSFTIPNLSTKMNLRPLWAMWAPPVWFLGLDQAISGNHDLLATRLALRSIVGLVGAGAAAVLTYVWSYRRHRTRVVESPELESNARMAFPPALTTWLVPDPRALAVFGFTSKSLTRSRHHRLILTAFCAAALAVISQGIAGSVGRSALQQQAAIAAPLALSLFVLTGLRYLFRHPVELRANWLFRIHQPGNAAKLLAGVERFVVYCAVVPIALLTLPAEMLVLGIGTGLLASLTCLLLSLMLMETLLFSFEKIPFTSSYLPGRRPIIETVLRGSVVSVLWVGGLSSIVRWSLNSVASSVGLIVLLFAGWWKARGARLGWQRVDRLEFEEMQDPAVQVLSIDRD